MFDEDDVREDLYNRRMENRKYNNPDPRDPEFSGPENVYWYCENCDEEFYLPEDIEKCPICLGKDIETV